jgi:hypothetical protein
MISVYVKRYLPLAFYYCHNAAIPAPTTARKGVRQGLDGLKAHQTP